MTAILNFTLPNLDVPASNAAAPGASSSGLRLEAREAAASVNRGTASEDNGKEFGELLSNRIVKKETGKDGNFDASEHSETEPGKEIAAILVTGPRSNSPSPASENLSTNSGKEISIKLLADPLLDKVDVDTGVEDGSTEGEPAAKLAVLSTDTEAPESAGKSVIMRTSGEEIALARSADAKLQSTTGQAADNAGKAAPAGSQHTLTSQAVSQGPVSQTRVTAPIRSDDIPTSISLNAVPQTSRMTPPAGEAEELTPAPARQNQSAPPDAPSKTTRPVAGQRADTLAQTDDGTAEFAAASGKQLPDSGKPLPSVLLQTPAQHAPGLSSRTEIMTRSVRNGRQRSIGRESGEVPGLEKAARLSNSVPLSELVGKAVGQVLPTVSIETGMHTQTTASDPQATGLLAQHLAPVERATSYKIPGALTGPEANNTFSLQLQPGSQEMSAQLGSRIRWMGNLNISSAELKLYPAELGTLEIMITAEDDQARVNFVTSTSAAKELIEASLPRLRELLGQSGMLLEQGDVTHRDLSKNSSDNALPVVESQTVESLETETLEQTMPMYQRSASDSRIDHFA